MTEREIRESFEAWIFNETGHVAVRYHKGPQKGQYIASSVATSWAAWQAAMASQSKRVRFTPPSKYSLPWPMEA